MPTQTRSSRKKEAKGKGQPFTYQDNPYYMKDPFTDKPSSSGVPVFDEPESPTIHETEYNDKDNLNVHETNNDSSSSEAKEDTETPEKKICDWQKDKDFRKMMKAIMTREKEDYFLELAKQGAKFPTRYDVQTLITKKEESPILMVHKQLLALRTEITELKNKDKSPK